MRFPIPSIWFNQKLEDNSLCPDDYGMCFDGTRRLLELGHKRISFIQIQSEAGHYSTQDRRSA